MTGAPLAGQTTAQNAARSSARADRSHCPNAVFYALTNYESTVSVFDQSLSRKRPCGTITGVGEAQGLAVDASGNLWVTDARGQQIIAFSPGASAPSVTLSDPSGVPVGVAVDSKSGNVYVTDYSNTSDTTVAVEVYENGSTTPTRTLNDPQMRNAHSVAVDNQGNVYATFMTQSNKAQVDEWFQGAGNPKNLGLQLVSAGGIVTTSTGALAVCDPYAFHCGEFAVGSTKLSHIFAHHGTGRGSLGPDKPPWLHPDSLTLDASETHAFVTSNSISSWTFPGSNHKPLVEIKVTGGAEAGIAAGPAAPPGAPYQ